MVGCSSAGTVSRPWTTVAVPSAGSDSHEARPGIGMPPVTRAVGVEVAEQRLGDVARRSSGTSSMAANLIGWLLYTQRASESPTPIWIGMAIGADGERRSGSRGGGSGRAGPRSMPTA